MQQRSQFRLLLRMFLFRVVELDVLAPQGNTSKLLGQIAALLIVVSVWLLFPAVVASGGPPSQATLLVTWATEHLLISTTMFSVGLLAVLSWEGMFPDRRDLMVLFPLPMRIYVLFAAKIASIAAASVVAILCLNFLPGLLAPFTLSDAPVWKGQHYGPALPPVFVTDLKPILDRDISAQKDPETGHFYVGNDAGIVVGVVQHGVRRVMAYGTARPESIFELGSITKTFTGLLLAHAVTENRVQLQTPVRVLLTSMAIPKPAGSEITLLDLATQYSGLPRMPDNFHPADPQNPYADYRAGDLADFMIKRGVSKPFRPRYLYSNLGFGLLGEALSEHASVPFATLLKSEVTDPLGINDTRITLGSEQQQRLIQGHSGDDQHRPVPSWELDALAGAGALRSTAGDMLTYLEAQIHPEKHPTLAPALDLSHGLRAQTTPGRQIALAWQFDTKSGIFEHGGATAGYTSYAFFDPKNDCAAIVLMNTGPNLALPADRLGAYVRQRLAGLPAVTLTRMLAAGKAGLLGELRVLVAYWTTLFASGVFILFLVVSVQGAAQLLPRQLFLRVSTPLQMIVFCLLILAYFFQAPFAGLETLADQQGRLIYVPSYWFFGLFQFLNGTLPPFMDDLAKRAGFGLLMCTIGAISAYLVYYRRNLQRVVEQPDIEPVNERFSWLPRFGDSIQTAIGQFAMRTLFRSRQHRILLAFYVGMSLGLTFFISKTPLLREEGQSDTSLIVFSFLAMFSAITGIRCMFALPLETRANWIFQITASSDIDRYTVANRRALYLMAVTPALVVIAALAFSAWIWTVAAAHCILLLVFGLAAVELALLRFRKIPFTCALLPGKSSFHIAALLFLVGAFRLNEVAALEQRAFHRPAQYVFLLAIVGSVFAITRWRNRPDADSLQTSFIFEEQPDPAILELGLTQDGVSAARFANR
jgi:CubicO group peptidase (beta-lactamase class C family)